MYGYFLLIKIRFSLKEFSCAAAAQLSVRPPRIRSSTPLAVRNCSERAPRSRRISRFIIRSAGAYACCLHWDLLIVSSSCAQTWSDSRLDTPCQIKQSTDHIFILPACIQVWLYCKCGAKSKGTYSCFNNMYPLCIRTRSALNTLRVTASQERSLQ